MVLISKKEKYLYRFEERHYHTGINEYNETIGKYMKVELRRFKVIKFTPCGVWIQLSSRLKFVLLTARKQYACINIKNARISFKARKRKQKWS